VLGIVPDDGNWVRNVKGDDTAVVVGVQEGDLGPWTRALVKLLWW